MTEYPAGRDSRSGDLAPRLRVAALTAVIVGVVLLAAAAFLLSYSGIHHIALQAGVSPKLARLYPLIFDAMLVIVCAALLALRTAGVPTRCYVWFCLIVLLAAVAAGDAIHATGTTLPRQPSRAGVAITPWALVLLSFGLLLAMLRHLRRVRTAGRGPADADAAAVARPAPRSGLVSLLEPRAGEPPALPVTEHSAGAAAGAAPAPTGRAVPADPTAPVPTAPAPDAPVSDAPVSDAAVSDTAAGPAASPGPTTQASSAPPAFGGGYRADASYPASAYYGSQGPDETEEYLGTEDYGGVEDYGDPEEFHPGHGGADEVASRDGSPGGGADDGSSPGQDMPASAPPPQFDRMRSTPTRPEE